MNFLIPLFTLLALGLAFPAKSNLDAESRHRVARLASQTLMMLREENVPTLRLPPFPHPKDALRFSRAETNCGPTTPCSYFDASDQFVSVEGEHEYVAPTSDQIRGPCPGLNAAANHAYIPRSGIASIEEVARGLNKLYNLGIELGIFLAAYAVVTNGDLKDGTFSIGGPHSDTLVPNLGNGRGLSYSHNSFEGDASFGRPDAFTNHGDAHSLSVERFEAAYATGGNDTSEHGLDQRYTLDKFRAHYQEVQEYSIKTNPYYFTGTVSTIAIVPGSYNLVINLMSNHSEEEPSGYLDGYNLKQFFGVTGHPGSFIWQKGQERVPKNWYRRPTISPYSLADSLADIGIGYLAYPKTLKIGGNNGSVNSFTGISLEDLTGGALKVKDLFKDDNFACFTFALGQHAITQGWLEAVKNSTDFMDGLECVVLENFDQNLFNKFPGYQYNPIGPTTNYKM
ncbi:hypothetical protein N7450_005572 [Penicillium hetheringtonii]|uniref:Heme haloperoxidase family profile domain-containing protein n=1 Tax=Penicillium hetheringtonii TaxID=911720 RepID=A0AAD6GR51_9EURO|nr:hypothetical protein N7450_005572 [Penicillium hetheringtonii]